MHDLIDRQAAISYAISGRIRTLPTSEDGENWIRTSEVRQSLLTMPSAQPEQQRTFAELVVEYPDPELCTYKEFKGKPYYSIKYIENGEAYVGYGTYKPEVLSRYLREYFMSSAQPEPQWIPCSERLPEKKTEVIYSLENRYVSTGYMTDRDYEGNIVKLHWEDIESGALIYPEAWMPMPKPYTEGGE